MRSDLVGKCQVRERLTSVCRLNGTIVCDEHRIYLYRRTEQDRTTTNSTYYDTFRLKGVDDARRGVMEVARSRAIVPFLNEGRRATYIMFRGTTHAYYMRTISHISFAAFTDSRHWGSSHHGRRLRQNFEGSEHTFLLSLLLERGGDRVPRAQIESLDGGQRARLIVLGLRRRRRHSPTAAATLCKQPRVP